MRHAVLIAIAAFAAAALAGCGKKGPLLPPPAAQAETPAQTQTPAPAETPAA